MTAVDYYWRRNAGSDDSVQEPSAKELGGSGHALTALEKVNSLRQACLAQSFEVGLKFAGLLCRQSLLKIGK